MRILKNNSGVTLIELMVSLAILALLSTAIVGIMSSNTQVFRKNKTDIAIQTNAEEVYNKISEDIMQARYVYVEGYLCSGQVAFSNSKVGEVAKDSSGGNLTFNKIKLLKESDVNLINLAYDVSSSNCVNYLETLVGSTVTDRPAAEAIQRQNAKNSLLEDEFDSFYENVKNMEWYEARRYGEFLDHVCASTTAPSGDFTTFNSSTIKNSSSGTNVFGNVYVTKIVMEYSVPLDVSKVTDNSKIETYKYSDPQNPNDPTKDKTANAPDYVIVEYTFSANNMYVKYDYHAMDAYDTDVSNPDNALYTNLLNYVTPGDMSAVEAQFDAENESFKLDLHFTRNKMNYVDRGMTKIRNSYVLHDAK